jgi:hypothetical protein
VTNLHQGSSKGRQVVTNGATVRSLAARYRALAAEEPDLDLRARLLKGAKFHEERLERLTRERLGAKERSLLGCRDRYLSD